MTFELHPRLEADTTWLGDFPLCRILLSKENIGPWIILVPKVDGVTELHHLSDTDQQQFMRESSLLAAKLEFHTNADKLNMGALGNMVPQLHVHHIARFQDDAAWPAPVWGNTQGITRNDESQAAVVEMWKAHLNEIDGFSPATS
ncbi:HIT domain-containing protein [Enterovibrio makurazakiensis]|uniref:HIT domain-containing protein n=1 Tax=Enterovibrio gelatinilyticus TaxID=2899819 RepID=A0ABT5R062_9GAMM|nr:HIT domain-containing protein [Enterovibrio sp. ZSDZ42]MDD1792927.1 HIT domain-containing protein [Enterovibrio sp. ZSDZ42]